MLLTSILLTYFMSFYTSTVYFTSLPFRSYQENSLSLPCSRCEEEIYHTWKTTLRGNEKWQDDHPEEKKRESIRRGKRVPYQIPSQWVLFCHCYKCMLGVVCANARSTFSRNLLCGILHTRIPFVSFSCPTKSFSRTLATS